MGSLPSSVLVRRFPRVLLATFAVVGLPVVVVSALSATGAVTSFILLVAIGMALSVAASYCGTKIWARIHSGDVVFAELMIWGWVRRWRLERQLASAIRILGLEDRAVLEEGSADGKSDLDTTDLSAARHVSVLKQLAAALEGRYPDTHGHSRRVARHATVIAKRMGLSAEEVARVRTAATVHDVGKVDLSPSIINKPAKLNDAEFAAIKKHPTIGAEMVTPLDDEKLTGMVRHHHERLDGRGYPEGLEGDEIPLGARIIAVADTFDALTSSRPYRSARRHKQALAILNEEAGSQLDPDAVRAFRGYYSGYRVVALWALMLNGPRQLLTSLAGEAKLGSMSAAATVATVAVGTVAVHSFHADHAVPPSPPKTQAAFSSAGAPMQVVAMLGPTNLEERRAVDAEVAGALGRMSMTAGRASASGEVLALAGDDTGGSTPTRGAAPSSSAKTPVADSTVRATKTSSDTPHSVTVSDTPDLAVSTTEQGQAKGGGNGRGSEKRSENSNAGGNGKGASGGNGNAGGNSGGNSHREESVTLPQQASEKAKEAVEDVVKGVGSAPASGSPPAVAVESSPSDGKGKGKSNLVP